MGLTSRDGTRETFNKAGSRSAAGSGGGFGGAEIKKNIVKDERTSTLILMNPVLYHSEELTHLRFLPLVVLLH